MLLPEPWDRSNPRSVPPDWLPDAVDRALAGISRKHSHRMSKSAYDGIHYSYTDVSFACDCSVIGDRGWEPCTWPFHRLLAQRPSKSRIPQNYFRLRIVFDSVLETAWTRRPMHHDTETHLRASGHSLQEY